MMHLPIAGIISGAGQSTLLDNLVSWWNLDETSGTRSDSEGSNDLTETNTVGYTTGKVSNAADFIDANNEYLSKASATGVNGGDRDFTVAFWMNTDNTFLRYWLKLGELNTTTASNMDWNFTLSSSQMVFSGIATATAQSITASSFGALSLGTWYFVVGWHDATANTLNIQINNGTVDTNSSFTTLTHQANATTLQMGGGRSATSHVDGHMDEAAFWDRVLTAAERTELYNSGNGIGYPG